METKTEIPSYEMFSKTGSMLCHNLTMRVIKKVNGKKRVTEEELNKMIGAGMEKIQKKHGEVYDSEPGYHIQWRVNKVLEEVGYSFELSRYNFHTK